MGIYKVGDRVAYRARPRDCGTVMAVLTESGDGAVLRIAWDKRPPGVSAESALVRCVCDQQAEPARPTAAPASR